LSAHHRCVKDPFKEHHKGDHDVHPADPLGIKRSEPLMPKPFPPLEVKEQTTDESCAQNHRNDSPIDNCIVVKGSPS